MQAHVTEAGKNHTEAQELAAAQAEAASELLAARAAAAAREADAVRARDAVAAAKKLLEHPPEPLLLEATSLSESDAVKRFTLDQLLDYTPHDTKARTRDSHHISV